MNPRFVFKAGKDPVAADPCHQFADTAQFALLFLDHLKAPAARLRIALIHAHEVGRKERRLLPSCAGPDFQDRRSRIRLVARQERQLQPLLHLRQPRLQRRHLFARQIAHLRVAQHRARALQIVQRLPIGADFLDHGPQFRILAPEAGNIATALHHLRLDKVKALRDLLQSVQGYHG